MEIYGQWFSSDVVERINRRVAECPDISRRALSREVCEWLDWRSASGRLKDMSCRKALLELDRQGVIQLPACTREYAFQKRREGPVCQVPQGPEVSCSLAELGEVELVLVPSRYSKLSRVWNDLMSAHHPLGKGPLCGAQLRYLIRSERHGWLGGLAFSGASKKLGARDRWIGWSATARDANLWQVVCNSRFLILPTVSVPCLASHVLSRALGRLAADWDARYAYRPVLVETFVDPAVHKGISYRAANWQYVGGTAGRGTAHANGKVSQVAKDVYVRPLCKGWRATMCASPERTLRDRPGLVGAEDWVQEEFGRAQLGDGRLKKRLFTVVRDMYAQPGAQIPEACSGSRPKTKGAYRFLDNARVDMQTLIASHTEATVERVRQCSVVLAVQDTTLLNYTEHAARGMGPINTKKDAAVGLILHDTMAFTLQGTPLGLIDAQCWARDPNTTGKREQRKELPLEQKESMKWLRSYRAAAAVQKLCPGTMLVSTGDREADIYDLFAEAAANPDGPKLLIRAEKSRGRLAKCDAEMVAEETSEEDPEYERLWQHMAAKPLAGLVDIEVPPRDNRPRRDAKLELRVASVELKAPKGSKLPACQVWAVLAQEVDAAEDVKEPVEWMLLTTVPTDGFEAGVERLGWYVRRWGIEVYHRTIKSGTRTQDRRLNTAEGIKACLAIDLVIAWRVHMLTMLARETPDVSCEAYLEEIEWRVLCAHAAPDHDPDCPPTLRQAVRWLAALGGFLGRKCDGDPGNTTVWRGLDRLSAMVQGYLLALEDIRKHYPALGP